MAFAAEFDPQPMHLDEAAAQASMLGGLAASGWHSLLPDDAHDHRWLPRRGELPGRARRRRGALARAGAAGRQPHACAPPCSRRASRAAVRTSASSSSCCELFNAGASEPVMTLTVSPMFARRDATRAADDRSAHEILRRHRIGDRDELGSHTFTAEEIKTFAARFDPQPFHLDEEAAARIAFRRLCAPRAGTPRRCGCACWSITAATRTPSVARAASRWRSSAPSPGFRELKWLKPVYAGDTITYAGEVLEMRAVAEPARMGSDDGAQHRHQPARRAGDVVRQRGLRRAPRRGATP